MSPWSIFGFIGGGLAVAVGLVVVVYYVATPRDLTESAPVSSVSVAETAADTQGEPTGFRDIRWGASEAAIAQVVGAFELCSNEVTPSAQFGNRFCIAKDGVMVGDISPKMLTFYFRDGAFAAWIMTSYPSARSTLKSALVEKYGRPTKESGETAAWNGRRARAMLADDSLIVVTTQEVALNEIDKKQSARNTAKGL